MLTYAMCVVEGVQQCSGPIVWDSTLLASSTDWWNWPMSKRFGDCKCYKEIEVRQYLYCNTSKEVQKYKF